MNHSGVPVVFVSHLESAIDGTQLPANQLQTLHADRPLWVRYNLNAVGRWFEKEKLRDREQTMWRYRELLPLPNGVRPVSLGEGMTPILECERLASEFGLRDVWVKDESHLPTGSFKSRGLAMAITMAKHFRVKRVALPSAGNAGGAAAAYAARAGMECFVFMPEDTPVINQYECQLAGAKTFLVNGLINDCGKIVRQGKEAMGWFDLSTLKEPYRIEGKKTMGLELAEQFDWKLPDVILYPTGGGTGLIGMWKAFEELRELGWLESKKMPRMVSVQSTGCAPIATAFDKGERFAEPFANAATIASGIRVPVAVGDFMILDAVRASKGLSISVEESRIREWLELTCRLEGIAVCPETAACVGALESLTARGWIKRNEQVVIFNTGAAQKYVEAIRTDLPRLDVKSSIDWERLARGEAGTSASCSTGPCGLADSAKENHPTHEGSGDTTSEPPAVTEPVPAEAPASPQG
ncbi:MAG: threonine synthase [Planctomycetes bacterium]|nr:threonine synthase [Planctomycetota bacterium]